MTKFDFHISTCRQLRSESLQLKEEFQKEVKSKYRLSMENEELQWRLKQAMESHRKS
ncbi:microtubule-associated tumor suppressor 1 homolog [Tachypleus tridentatus]|uniref:microtubule-associated tumor suppressor 1 homolog n=1 Tax=Tachypleus tridentatus TaxID=6853 RepID=UPI003FD67796